MHIKQIKKENPQPQQFERVLKKVTNDTTIYTIDHTQYRIFHLLNMQYFI